MGLDMYLFKKTYVQNWPHYEPHERHKITIEGPDASQIKPERIAFIVEQVAYWRKANAIHRWFVENVQDGKDDCGEYPVEREQLRELVELCRRALSLIETVPGAIHTGTVYYPDGRVVKETRPGEVVANPDAVKNLLPTQGGFFFGSTDYDDGYVADLQDTIQQIEPLLGEEEGEFYYEASW